MIMEDTPTVSIVLPVFNGEKNILEAVQSILNQSFEDFELIVINDGSTDNTLNMLEGLKDKRIKVIDNKKNLKISKSLNKGFQVSKGKYIARMDADDICNVDRLEKQIQHMEAHPEIGVCGTFQYFFGDFRLRNKNRTAVNPEEIKASLLFGPTMLHPTVMFRTSILDKYKILYDESYDYCEDYELWVRMSESTKLNNIPEFLCGYRWDGEKKWSTDFDSLMSGLKRIWLKQLDRLGVIPTSEQLQIHALLGGRAGKLNIRNLILALKYLKFLNEKNRDTKVYQEKEFKEMLNKFWYLLFRRACKKNIILLPLLPICGLFLNSSC